MRYRQGQFDLVVDSGNFNPFQSMQEMLVPFQAYKEAYEKMDEDYTALNKNASTFQYLADRLPENSRAAKIYQGYANDLRAQADDLARNGLTIGNRRGLSLMKRRYDSEIGRLSQADAAMQAEKNRRLTNKDTSMLYATDNLDIDDFLDNNSPNLYSVSGNALFNKGAILGKSMSEREVHSGDAGSVLGNYYRNWRETRGIAGADIREFMARPEVQEELSKIMEAEGLDNLTGINRQRAEAQLLSGMATGIVYEEKNQLHRDPGVMSAQERAASARADAQQKIAQEKWDREKQEYDIMMGLKYRQKTDEKGQPMVDANGKPVLELNPEYMKNNGYSLNPNTNKWEANNKSVQQTAEEKKAAAEESKKGAAMMKLEKKDLAHNEGFDVAFGDNRHHYDYIGAISKHGDKWHTGAIGENNPGHWGWGFMSTSNVENAWGNFSAEGSDANDMRVLSGDEFLRLVSSDQGILDAIEERCKAAGVDPKTADIQIVEVPNEKGGSGQKGYLIAVH